MDAEESRLKNVVKEKLAETIIRARTGKIKITPGYDGVYGEMASERSIEAGKRIQKEKNQRMLGDF
jgi:PHP family Zn ribbon phosphoesterase